MERGVQRGSAPLLVLPRKNKGVPQIAGFSLSPPGQEEENKSGLTLLGCDTIIPTGHNSPDSTSTGPSILRILCALGG